MTVTFTWGIPQLERETSDGYVYAVHYTVDAEDDTYKVGAYGSIRLDRPEGDLIPFDSLTKEKVIAWVKEKLTEEKVSEVETALQAQLDEKRTPTKAVGVPSTWS